MRNWVFFPGQIRGHRRSGAEAGGEAGKARVGRLTDRRTNGAGRTGDPAKRRREPKTKGVRGPAEARRDLLPTWGRILGSPPGLRADRAASGLRLPPPASPGARAGWPAQRRKRKGTVIATRRLHSALGEGQRIPTLNQLNDRSKIVELLICEDRLMMTTVTILYVFAYPT